MQGSGGSSLLSDISCAGLRSGMTRLLTFDHPFTVQRRLRPADVGDRREESVGKHWDEALEGVLAGLGAWAEEIWTGDPVREGVARGDVDDDEDAFVPSGVDKGEWPDAERASAAAARVERMAEGCSDSAPGLWKMDPM